MADETTENGQLSAAPESRETQQAAPQETAIPASPDEGRIRAENRENREGLSRGVNDPEAALQQGLAAISHQEGAKAGTLEEDLGTNKGAMDKISDGMQKMFALVQKFMKQLQSMGSSTLRGMADTLSMLGFKQAAEWLNKMAGADYAELMTAMQKNNLKLAVINPEDADAKAKTELAEGAQAQMADRYKVLAQTRGPAFTREVFYSETVTAWKKQGGNGSKTQITTEDLQTMAAAARELPATLPGQVAQPQQAQAPAVAAAVEKPENFPTVDTLPLETNLMLPAKINFNGQVLTMQAVADGFMINGMHYRAMHTVLNVVPTFLSVVRSANGIKIKGSALGKERENELPLAKAKELLAALGAGTQPYTNGDFRFDKV